MDPKQLQQLIETVAEFEPVRPVRVANIKQTRDDEAEVLYHGEFININLQNNPTLGYRLKKFKSEPKLCELNCGRMVKNQVIEHRVYTEPELHWRTKCTNCKKTVGPNGELIHDNKQVYPIFLSYFRNKTK